VIAHIAGLPIEETIPQLAPVAAGAAVAVGLLIERARSRLRSLAPRDRDGRQTSVDERD
jgi:hypothetical protein